MFNHPMFFNDLNMILLGFLVTCAGFMGYLANPALNAVLGVLAGVYGSWKYKLKKEEIIETNDLHEKFKNYKMPSTKDLASRIIDSNPELSASLSPRALAIYNQAYRKKSFDRHPSKNKSTENPINIKNSKSNVFNLEDYRNSKKSFNSPKEVS